ncbi:RNA polymerase factor sigma-54 [Notoacmeibacter sp. MSK16QG-6]|uniref:RNA polymerase factor sigma-54 n=1 Tax=Notoacmeibacter sp. MSK16QG-6 TaxID=2957982 RepID=UPI0020A1D77B|nr:RNA polymerase factor sigma-54 [Notoacmeibacter sp. MSK16QG-6]MCP1198889.1 RNA polymerase factor sigma-54 [Notoacmeibacter sp. MSK16QG-6]
MSLSARLQLRQSQSLVMTPQLMQSIRLLQFGQAELDRFIDEEIERNPLLEKGDSASGEDAFTGEEQTGRKGTESRDMIEGGADSAEIASIMDTDLHNVFPDDPGSTPTVSPDLAGQWKSSGGGTPTIGGDTDDLDAFAAAPVTLSDRIAEQIAFSFRTAGDRLIAGELADLLDECGYLRAELDDVASRLGAEREDVEAVLAVCQRFEPTGIFARTLAECLAAQLAAKDRLDPAMAALVDNLELLARRDFQALRTICGVGEDDLIDMLGEIKRLDPRPGAQMGRVFADEIIPDVLVTPASDGSWQVELNGEALPRVLIDQAYVARVSHSSSDKEEKAFVSECLANAQWLTRSLDQRAKTILKVASEIIRRQDAFLIHGVSELRPLNLKTVADAIGMHESTVSRVTSNKYLLTPRGTFEMRYFFTAALAAVEGGQSHSAEAVRHRIRQLVESETASAVFSDDQIVGRLQKEGIDIARRTVAKYREAMNIPSSVQRRREKKALAQAATL